MNDFELLLDKVKKYDVHKILFEVWSNPKVKLYIENLNTEKQMHEQGVDSLGVTLGQYTAYTKQIKISKGQRIDHVTLKDSGEFYESFDIKPLKKGFKVVADTQKDDTDLLVAYGKDILGLTDESIELLVKFIEPYYIEASKKILS